VTIILDGRKVASKVYKNLEPKISFLEENNIKPNLAIILTTRDKRSLRYAEMKKRIFNENKAMANIFEPKSQEEVKRLLNNLNTDDSYHGIFIQLPLEKSLNKSTILSKLDPSKDIDCMSPNSLGRLLIGKELYSPANVEAIFQILRHYEIKINRKWGIVGIDNILGRPLISKLCAKGLRFSSYSPSSNFIDSKIVVSDIQKIHSIKKNQVTKDSILLDNGNNYNRRKVYGDFDYKNAKEIAHAITPVPGGIGPVTVAMLLSNLIKASTKQLKKTIP
jgi:methylenetetrahydrofolate dehydrogenase (NADP+)/methenyltetrahydrofolate cyclohydrolase